MRDKVALGNIGVPTPAYRVLGDPSPCRGFNVGPSHLALLTKLQIVDDLDLEGGDPAQRGRPGALLGTVSEVGKARSGQRSSKIPLNRVGSLEQMVESEHCRIVSGCVEPRINGEQRSPLGVIRGAGGDSERWVGV